MIALLLPSECIPGATEPVVFAIFPFLIPLGMDAMMKAEGSASSTIQRNMTLSTGSAAS
jgi:hypothetical protein